MCIPVATLAIIGTAVSGLGAMQQAGNQAAMYKYQANIASENAKIEVEKQRQINVRGQLAERKNALDWQQKQAQIRTSMASAGVSGGVGDSILADAYRAEDFDAHAIAYNALASTWGSQVAQTNFLAQRNQYNAAQGFAKQEQILAGFRTFAGVASQTSGLNNPSSNGPNIPGRSGLTTVPTIWG